MIVIYDAANSVEAHMILHLLQQSGIKGRVDGEYLQGAMGGLPATGNVRVTVMPQDADEAKKIIAEWESIRPPDAPAPASTKQPASSGQKAKYFLAGAVVAAVVTFQMFRYPGTSEGFDYDGDGKLDEVHYWQGGITSKIEQDRNKDGNMDLRWLYALNGVVKAREADNDFNGTFETVTQYVDGNPAVSRIDSSGDGSRDIHETYENGVLTESELFDPLTNFVIKKNQYNAFGKVVESELDTDGNGSLDLKTTYDAFGEPHD